MPIWRIKHDDVIIDCHWSAFLLSRGSYHCRYSSESIYHFLSIAIRQKLILKQRNRTLFSSHHLSCIIYKIYRWVINIGAHYYTQSIGRYGFPAWSIILYTSTNIDEGCLGSARNTINWVCSVIQLYPHLLWFYIIKLIIKQLLDYTTAVVSDLSSTGPQLEDTDLDCSNYKPYTPLTLFMLFVTKSNAQKYKLSRIYI